MRADKKCQTQILTLVKRSPGLSPCMFHSPYAHSVLFNVATHQIPALDKPIPCLTQASTKELDVAGEKIQRF